MTTRNGGDSFAALPLALACTLIPVLALAASAGARAAQAENAADAPAAPPAASPAPDAAAVPPAGPPPLGDVLPAIQARYSVSWGGLGVGTIDVSLKPEGGSGCYSYTTESHPTALARSLYGAPNEASQFCVKNGQVRSKHFNTVLPGDGKQSYTLSFDWDKHSVTDQDGFTRTIPDNAVDSFALQQAVRLWVSAHARDANPPIAEFDMVDRKNLTHYQFKLTGHETIETHAGSFDALKMERIDNPKKEGHFWLAAERGYMPVKITTRSGSKPTVMMLLTK